MFALFIHIIKTIALSYILVSTIDAFLKTKNKNVSQLTTSITIVAVSSIIILFLYASELFTAYYSGATYEFEAHKIRWTGPYFWVPATNIAGSFGLALLLIPKLRSSIRYLLVVSIFAVIFSSEYTEPLLIYLST